MLNRTLLFLISGLFFFSCQKDDVTSPTTTNGSELSTEKGQYSFANGSLSFKGPKEYTYEGLVCNIYRNTGGGDVFDLGGTIQSTGGTAKGSRCRVEFPANVTIEANKNYPVNILTSSLIFANPKEQDGYVYRVKDVSIIFSVLTNNQVKGTINGTFERFFPNEIVSATVSFDYKK